MTTTTQSETRTVADTQGTPELFVSGGDRYYRVCRDITGEGYAYAINVDTAEYVTNPDFKIDHVIKE